MTLRVMVATMLAGCAAGEQVDFGGPEQADVEIRAVVRSAPDSERPAPHIHTHHVAGPREFRIDPQEISSDARALFVGCAGHSTYWVVEGTGDVMRSGAVSARTVASGARRGAGAMAVNSGAVYLMVGSTVRVISDDGGVVDLPAPGIRLMAAGDRGLVWYDGSALRFPDGGSIAAVDARSLAATSAGAFWLSASGVVSLATNGTNEEVGASAPPLSPYALADVDGAPAWGSSDGLHRLDAQGTQVTTPGSVAKVAAGGRSIAWVDSDVVHVSSVDGSDHDAVPASARVLSLAACKGRAVWSTNDGRIWSARTPG